MTVRVVLAGCGAWGTKLLRVLAESPLASVVAVADPQPSALARARDLAPRAQLAPDLAAALATGPDAVVIATPPSTHAELALLALDAGADLLVEKPLAVSPADAERCAARARALGRVAMVGHLMRYHPTVARLVAMAREGALGEVRRVTAARLSSGGSASESAASVLWRLGPHDVSLVHAIGGDPLAAIEARATGGHVRIEARTARGLAARIDLSRTSPTKERLLSVGGTDAVATFDDVRAPGTILLGGAAEGARVIRAIEVPFREPLAVEIEHFLRCVVSREAPLTPLEEGARVVRALAAAEAELLCEARGGRDDLDRALARTA